MLDSENNLKANAAPINGSAVSNRVKTTKPSLDDSSKKLHPSTNHSHQLIRFQRKDSNVDVLTKAHN